MSDPVILFVKPKAISQRDKKALKTAGVLVVEVANVADVKLVRAHAELSGSDLLLSALAAIKNSGDYSKKLFSDAICAAIDATTKAKP